MNPMPRAETARIGQLRTIALASDESKCQTLTVLTVRAGPMDEAAYPLVRTITREAR